MLYDKLKGGRNIVLGPVKNDNPGGNHYIFSLDDFKVRKIHYYELQKQYKLKVIVKNPNNKIKQLAFCNHTGNVLAIVSRVGRIYNGYVLKRSSTIGLLFTRFEYDMNTVSLAPEEFYITLEDTIRFPYESN